MAGPVSFWKTVTLDYTFLVAALFGATLLTVFLSGPSILIALAVDPSALDLLLLVAFGHIVAVGAYSAGNMMEQWDKLDGDPSLAEILQSKDVVDEGEEITRYQMILVILLLAAWINTVLVFSGAIGLLAGMLYSPQVVPLVALAVPILDRLMFDWVGLSPTTAVVKAGAFILGAVSGTKIRTRQIPIFPTRH